MKVNLRFGMHKEIEVIHTAKQLVDGLIIPSHILAYQLASTASFVCSLPTHGYAIDPMTWILQSPRYAHEKKGELRPSVARWCDALHPLLTKILTSGKRDAPVAPKEMPNLKELCQGNYRFQTQTVDIGLVDPRAKKYLKRYGTALARKPRCVIPPYFLFEQVGDAWYEISLECARLTKAGAQDVPVAPLILCKAAALNPDSIGKIAKDYAQFESALLWVESFQQSRAQPEETKAVRALVRALAKDRRPVETLYGGYLMMLMEADGLSAVSHGILYSQDKSAEAVPGAGGVPDRYYIPAFHDFRSLSQTNLILKQHPELAGTTKTAREIIGDDPDKVFLFATNPELLRVHFLEARKMECEKLKSTPIASLLKELRDTYQKYHKSVTALPNPDAILSGGEMKGLDYLISWAQSF